MGTKKSKISLSNKNKPLFLRPEFFGIIGIVVFVILTFIAIFYYPNYNFALQYLSELGVGNTAIIFNSGLIIGGLLLIPLFIYQYKQNSFLFQLISFLGTASMIFFIGVGLFPLTQELLHSFFAGMFFFTMTFTILFGLIQFIVKTVSKNIKNFAKNANAFPKKLYNPVALFFFSFTSLFSIACIISYLAIQTPAWQKLAAICIIIWAIVWIMIKEN